MWALDPKTRVPTGRGKDTDSTGETPSRQSLKVEAEIGVIQLQARVCQGLLAATRTQQTVMAPSEPSEETSTGYAIVSFFSPFLTLVISLSSIPPHFSSFVLHWSC